MKIQLERYRAALDERKQFVIGARVKHFLFGNGIVRSTVRTTNGFGEKGLQVEVVFDDGTTRAIEATVIALDKFSVIQEDIEPGK